jgi:diaminopimelate decarboxylase
VTLSGVLHSVLSSAARRSDAARTPDAAEQATLRRCEVYRRSFPMTEIALPADVLRSRAVAKWARENGLSVDTRSGEELAVAIAAGIHPNRMTVDADPMRESDLRATLNLAPGRVVVSSIKHVELLATAVEHRTQGIFVRVIDVNAPALTLADGQYSFQGGFRLDSTELDRVVAAIVNNARLDLLGLYCDVGVLEHDFVSYPAAIGHIITEMEHIRREHGAVLTRVGLGGGRTVPCGDWALELPGLAGQIDESLEDACATMRYPRPIVALSPGRALIEQHAA